MTHLTCSLECPSTSGQCGKRQLRGESRTLAAKACENKEIHVFKSELRRELQENGDVEPPIIHSDNVYAKAKSE